MTHAQNHIPPCPHYAECGGCQFQHLADAEYYAMKHGFVQGVVKRLGVPDSVLQDVVRIGEHTRRRAEFKVASNKGQIELGFFAAKTNDVVDIQRCLIILPEMEALLPVFRQHVQSLKKPGNLKSIQVTQVHGGFDVLLTCRAEMLAADQVAWAAFAKQQKILRIASVIGEGDPELLCESAPVTVCFGDVDVELPIGAFLQAAETAQHHITGIITHELKEAKRVVDLFSGCGTYSFPLKDGRQVAAYEGNYEMVTAMHNAIRRQGLEATIRAQARDLFTNPLRKDELNRFDAVVINPPRIGAKSQCQQLAGSDVKKIVMVSCNPSSFERDAALLITGGYHLRQTTPIDQFYWSRHLEVVGVFEKN